MQTTPNNPNRKKRSYSTEFKRAYLTRLLPDSISKQIPPSTRSSWKQKSLNTLYGYDFIYANDEQLDFYQLKERYRKLLKVTKALALIVMCYSEIINTSSRRNQLFKNSKDSLVKTISITASLVSLNRTFRWMKITHQQFYAWVNKVNCSHSILNLRPKNYPHQLTGSEVKVVRAYISNDDYTHWSLSSIYCQMLRQTKIFMSLATFRKYARWINPHLSQRRKRKQISIHVRKT